MTKIAWTAKAADDRPSHTRCRRLRPPLLAAALLVLLGLPLARLAGADAPAGAVAPTLLSHGSGDWFWLAQMRPAHAKTDGPQTLIYARSPGDPEWQQWKQLRSIGPRVTSLANRGPQLAVLLADGELLLIAPGGAATGPRLESADARLLTLSNDAETLWALAELPSGIVSLHPPEPLTRPTGAGLRTGVAATLPVSLPSRTTAPFTHAAPATVPSSEPATAASTEPDSAPSIDATTRATTIPTTHVATGPTSRLDPLAPAPQLNPRPAMLSLVKLSPAGWDGVIDLPPEVARLGDAVSLAIIGNSPYLATRGGLRGRGVLRIYRLEGDHWSPAGEAALPPEVISFQFLTGTPMPTIAIETSTASEPTRLLLFGPGGELRGVSPATRATTMPTTSPIVAGLVQGTTQPTTSDVATQPATLPATVAVVPARPIPGIPLEATRGSPPDGRTLAHATGCIRAVYGQTGALHEQAYDQLTGDPIGTPSPLGLVAPAYHAWATWIRNGLVTAAMLLAIAGSFRQREAMRAASEKIATLPLAPLGRRFTAGLIDALPIVVAFGLVEFRATPAAGYDWAADPLPLIGIAIYFLHTTLAEFIAGRSIGKAMLGLRVANLDGARATAGQILMRNVLRLIDVGLLFVPLLLIPFSPLRQRAGDAAAGTLVITASPPREDENVPPSVS